VRALDALSVELEVAAARFRLESAYRGAALEQRKRELSARIAALKQQIADNRERFAEQRRRSATAWRRLETELRGDVERVAISFERLFS